MNDLNVKCPNFIICNTRIPMGRSICHTCEHMFGILKIMNSIAKCSICLRKRKGVSQPTCCHIICIECFKQCYFVEGNPLFPYPEMKDEYDNDPYNIKWDEYPNITRWNKDCVQLEDIRDNKIYFNTQVCPFC